jgi:hypothetical protein
MTIEFKEINTTFYKNAVIHFDRLRKILKQLSLHSLDGW